MEKRLNYSERKIEDLLKEERKLKEKISVGSKHALPMQMSKN